MSLEKKIREMMHGYYRGSGCSPLFDSCEQELLEELGLVAQKIRELREKQKRGIYINLERVLGLLVEDSKEIEK